MKIHELNVESKKSAKRAGRGIAAGRGKTAGRGTKGQNARSGGKVRPGFEGGQNPLYLRLPKLKGFTSHRTPPATVTTDTLTALGKKNIDHTVLADAGVIADQYTKVKVVLGKNDVSATMNVKLDAASKSAQEAISKAKGGFTATSNKRQPKSDKK